MKPIVIRCGDPEGSAPLPLWLRGSRVRSFASPEEFLKKAPDVLRPDSLLLAVGPKALGGVRLLRRFPETALSVIAAPGGSQIPGVDVDSAEEPAVRERFARIRASLESFPPVAVQGDLGDTAVFLFLRYLLSRGLHGLEAQRDPGSPFGYSYPLCGIFFNDALETWPNDLVRLGFFNRRFHDLIHVCPRCDRYNLNFRETCPECSSANIGLGEVLHHFRCGQVLPEVDFQREDELVCPKCRHVLRHLGVDYDRPTEFYRCRGCTAVFNEPQNDVLCLACGGKSRLPELREHTVYNFFLTEEGRRGASEGIYLTGSVQELFDREIGGLYTSEFFQEFAKIELRRRKRYGGHLAVLGLLMDFPEDKQLSIKRIHQVAKALARLVRENLRDSDLFARLSDRLYLCLLTDTPAENVGVVASRLEKAVNEVLASSGGRLSIGDATQDFLELMKDGALDVAELSRRLAAGKRNGAEPVGGSA